MTTVSTGTEGTNTRRNAALTNNSNNQLNSPRLSEGALRGQRNASNGTETPPSAARVLEDDNVDRNNSTEKRADNAQSDVSLSTRSRTAAEELESSESAGIDPLSQHILKRTQTEKSIPYKLKSHTSYGQDSGGDGNKPSPTDPVNRSETFPLGPKTKEKK
ncbi:hypothetical protein F66182_17290 [Fusarium sp. NRRL 66182]|nr:hypothetical protein F66182_17290 [Fusarium sp. NRRL 66182]